MDDAETRFRKAIEPLVNKLEDLADSDIEDRRAGLDRSRESYYTAHAEYGCEYVREMFFSTSIDREATLQISRTMARSAGTTPRSWLVRRLGGQWNQTARRVTSSLRLLDRVVGTDGYVEAERRTRVRLREFYDEQAGADTHRAETMQSPTAGAPAVAAAAVSEPVPSVQPNKPVRQPLTTKELQERRDLLDRFGETYRQAKGRRPTNEQIAVVSRYRDRSAVVKYLSGEASEASVRNIEATLRMSPDEFDLTRGRRSGSNKLSAAGPRTAKRKLKLRSSKPRPHPPEPA
jgi:hypothetical protein